MKPRFSCIVGTSIAWALICMPHRNVEAIQNRVQDEHEKVPQNTYCGVACVYGMCKVQGVPADLSTLRHEFDARFADRKGRGFTFEQLAEVLESRDVKMRGVKYRRPMLINVSLPAIIHVGAEDGGHFALLTQIDGGNAYLIDYDVAHRQLKVPMKVLLKDWNGAALFWILSIGKTSYCSVLSAG